MTGTMPVMAKTRKGQQQPMRRGTGRQPGDALTAALRGTAAPGVASATGAADQKRMLAKNANKLADAITSKVSGAGFVPAKEAARKIPGPVSPALTGAKLGGAAPMPNGPSKRSLADATKKPANRSSSRSGSTGKPKTRTYSAAPEINKTKNERAGQEFNTFTVPGKSGEYHEYVDAEGNRKVVKVKKRTRGGAVGAP